MNNVSYLPIWKENSTAAEKLYELAHIAENEPDRFDKMIICHLDENGVIYWHTHGDMRRIEVIGLIEGLKFDIISQDNE